MIGENTVSAQLKVAIRNRYGKNKTISLENGLVMVKCYKCHH